MNKYDQTNKTTWDQLASVHPESPMYQEYIEGIKSGKGALNSIERELLGDITGQKALHFQCHIGTDTLSLAQMGASVTGVDFSEEALKQAAKLGEELGLSANWVHSSVIAPNLDLGNDFDLVFTTYGTICWYQDLDAWAANIVKHLKPGGRFLMVDGHPMATAFSQEIVSKEGKLQAAYPYFESDKPTAWEDDQTYAGDNIELPMQTSYEWMHSLSEIFSALLKVGLQIKHFNEYPFCVWKMFSNCERLEDGYYHPPEEWKPLVPMMYSFVAEKA